MTFYVPRRFLNNTTLDAERINDNLDALSIGIQANLNKRYSYSQPMKFDISADETTAAILSTFAIRRPTAGNALEVYAVELVLAETETSGRTWTLTCSDTSQPAIAITFDALNVEQVASSNVVVPIPSAASDVTWVLSTDGVDTTVAGYILFHVRTDRGNQGLSLAGYTPTLIDAASSTAGSVLDTQLTNAAAAVARDGAANVDLRCELFMVRSLSATNSVALNLPSGARRLHAITAYLVGTGSGDATFNVSGDDSGGTPFSIDLQVTDAGASTRVFGVHDEDPDLLLIDDPDDPGSDTVYTITADTGQTVTLGYMIVWWS